MAVRIGIKVALSIGVQRMVRSDLAASGVTAGDHGNGPKANRPYGG